MTDIHPDQASPARAEAAFAFLGDLGFRLVDRSATGGNSFKDGWRLVYSAPAATVTVQYLDTQFEVLFERSGVEASYLFIDLELFARRSGLHGSMFPPEKLAPVIQTIADDVRDHYTSLLSGDDAEWSRIKRLLDAPKIKACLP